MRAVKKRILLVEDNKVQKLVSERMLVRAGYEVLWAADGEHALSVANEQAPDLIVLDMLLPKLGGVGVLQALKQSPATEGIPVVALSALPGSNASKIAAEGAEEYFEKSKLYAGKNGEAALLGIIAKALQKHQRQAPTSGLHSTL